MEPSQQARLIPRGSGTIEMSFLKSLPPEASLLQIFQAFPEAAQPLLEYHEVLLRGESPFSPAERELIAAYISGLNNCNYCRAVHSQTAVALGISSNLTSKLHFDPHDRDVDARMRPVLAFVRRLTLSPGKITAADVEAIFAAGWNDRALYDATAICALFNLMNRLVNGFGIEASDAYTKMAAQRLAQNGYARLLEFLPTPK
jgi:uncharacterized peroxidase-related enzyme